MASIFTRDGMLYAKIKAVDGTWKQLATGCTVEQYDQAAKWVADQERRVDEQRARLRDGVIEIGPVTVRSWSKTWLEQRRELDLDWRNDRGRLETHVLPVIGDFPITEIRTRHIVALFHRIRTTKLERTKELPSQRLVYNIYSVISALFRDAKLADLITQTPCELDERQLGPLRDKNPEWRSEAVFTRGEVEIIISTSKIPNDRRVVYALELLAGVRPGEASALRWRHYDAAIEPLGKLLVAFGYNTRKHRVKGTKTEVTKHVPVHPTLAAILAAWKLSGWEAMMGREPKPDDLIVPLPPDAAARRRTRKGEAFRGHDYSGKRWREEDLPALEWRHRRHYDMRATFITLALEDGADQHILETRVTHTKRSRSAFDGYNRGLQWARTCAEVAKLNIRRMTSDLADVIALPRAASAGGSSSEDGRELGAVVVQSKKSPAIAIGKEWRRRESKRSDSSISTSTCPVL
jgi:integrase